MSADSIPELTDDTFAAQTAEGVWLVMFWDYTCGQCHRLNPVMEAVAGELDGKVSIARLNLTDCPRTAESERVDFLPLVAVYKDGERRAGIIGLKSKETYVQAVEKEL
jgi:thioredoxin 1